MTHHVKINDRLWDEICMVLDEDESVGGWVNSIVRAELRLLKDRSEHRAMAAVDGTCTHPRGSLTATASGVFCSRCGKRRV